MKKQAYTMIAMIALVGLMAVAARAQNNGRTTWTANIPFEFNAGDKTLPAGQYTVTQINPASDHAVLQLRSKDGSIAAMVQMGSLIGKAQESAKLIFNRYGSHYFFAQAWVDGANSGFEAPKSRLEQVAERKLAGISAQTETVALRNR